MHTVVALHAADAGVAHRANPRAGPQTEIAQQPVEFGRRHLLMHGQVIELAVNMGKHRLLQSRRLRHKKPRRDTEEWVYLPTGTCDKIVGASLYVPAKKK